MDAGSVDEVDLTDAGSVVGAGSVDEDDGSEDVG